MRRDAGYEIISTLPKLIQKRWQGDHRDSGKSFFFWCLPFFIRITWQKYFYKLYYIYLYIYYIYKYIYIYLYLYLIILYIIYIYNKIYLKKCMYINNLSLEENVTHIYKLHIIQITLLLLYNYITVLSLQFLSKFLQSDFENFAIVQKIKSYLRFFPNEPSANRPRAQVGSSMSRYQYSRNFPLQFPAKLVKLVYMGKTGSFGATSL